MAPIVIETSLEPQDWLDLQAYVMRRAGAKSAAFNGLAVIGVAVFSVAAAMLVEPLLGNSPNAGTAFLAVAICLCSLALLQKRFVRQLMPPKDGLTLGPHRIELDDAGIRTVHQGHTTFTDWTRVQQIDETPTLVLLPIDSHFAYLIPKRSVASQDLGGLVEQLRNWHADRTRTALHVGPEDFMEAVIRTEPLPARYVIQHAVESAGLAERPGFWSALRGNLTAGFRLATLRRVAPSELTTSFDQLTALLAVVLLLVAGFDRLYAGAGAELNPWGLLGWMYYALGGLWAAALVARWQNRDANTRALLVAWLATIPVLVVLVGLLLLIPYVRSQPLLVFGLAGGLLLGLSERVVRKVFGRTRIGTLVLLAAAIVGFPWFLQRHLFLDSHLWTRVEPETEREVDYAGDWESTESILFDEPARVAAAVERMAPERPGRPDAYFVGFAGHGSQGVFRSEVLLGEKVFDAHLGTGTRSLELINDVRDRDSYPLASVSSLRYALQLVGKHMDPAEDLLVLFLTSHGSREEGLDVTNGGLPLQSLSPEDLRAALDDAGIKWRVLVVSACYAGVFLEPLKSDSTLVITAADATHNSFGCADDRELTYFGEAFLRDALPGAASLEAAFTQARAAIAERERAESKTPSNPQIFVGPAIRQKLLQSRPWN